MRATSCVDLKRCSKKTKDIDKPLIREVSLQEKSLADGSLRMEGNQVFFFGESLHEKHLSHIHFKLIFFLGYIYLYLVILL